MILTFTKKILLTLLFLTTCYLVLQPIYAEEGEYAADFLSAGVGARAIGMGGAFVSMADDATATYWNPAGLAKIRRNAFSAMYSDVFESADGGFLSSGLVKYNFVNYIHNWSTVGTFGVSWIRLGIDDIPRTTFKDVNYNNRLGDFYDINGNGVKDPGELYIDRPEVAELFSNSDDAILVSYARPLSARLTVGGNFKLLRQSLFRNRAFGWGFDIGAIFKVIDGFQIGFIIQDATGTRITWNTPSSPTFVRSPNLRFGSSYLLPISIVKSAAIFSVDVDTDSGDIDSRNGSQFQNRLHYGVEYWLFNILALRAGRQKGELSVGAGFRIPLGNAAIYTDYAFATHEDLGGSQRISLSGQF
ncbi:MAG: PorV/PorQ family protein [Candidatus Poribacteria bacterium]